MKRFLTFLALCCLMAAGAWAAVTSVKVSPQNVGGVETYYVYTLQGKNQTSKYWAAPNGELNAMATTPTKWFFEDAGNGYYYIADYATGKYLCYTEVGRDKTVTLDATTTPSTWQIKLNGSYVTFCPSSSADYGLNCNDGHRMYDAGTGNGNTWWTMEESTETPGSSKTYTISITGATGATVTYGGTPYTSGQTITAENPTVSQFTASEVPGFYPSISIEANTINVTYNLLPFTTGKTYNLTLKGNGVYYDEATGYIKAGNVEDSDNTCFIIGGTYADGYTLKSVGADKYLKHENVNNDNAKATTTANESEATRYEYAVKDGYHYFKIRGTANNYVNYRDGYFSSWNNGSALGNDGSRLTFSEPIDPVKGYHIFQNGGTLHTTGSSAYCSQWTSSHANPQISINATDGNGAANDLEHNSTYANDGIVCYTGNNRDSQGYKITLTVAASFGYKITGFQFDASKADNSDYTIDVTAGGTTKTVSGTTVQHFSQTGVNAQEFVIVIKETAGSATHNKPILFNNFYVTYEAAEPLESEYKLVFDNAHSSVPYRIPAVGQTKDGDLIFVADYRYSGQDIGVVHDGKLDLKMRKKYANGEWGEEETLQACIDNGSEFMAFGDPCIVCDRESNSVMVTSCCGNVSFPDGTYENHQGWARWYSSDGGKTWESSFNTLAPQVVKQLDKRQGDKMNAFFIGSGKISQSHIIKKGQYYRLYCASNTRMQSGKCNFVWYSDDFGVTWNLLGSPDVKAINGGDEPKADELPDGSVVISSRDTGRIFNIFHYTDYENGTGYWGSQATSSSNNSGCYGTGCNGEILIVPVMKKSDNTKTYIALQSVPAASDRRNVSIYWKELTDFTKYRNASELAPEWTKFQVSGTTSAYSTMCQMKDGDIAFFYEENSHNNGYDMVYKKFSVEAITDNAYEFYDLNDAAKASEKAAYLTACVGTYFDEEADEVQALAQAYKADPTMKKYDALNAGFQSPDDLFFTPGLYQIQVASGTAQNHATYKDYYLFDNRSNNSTWPIGLTEDASVESTYVYIWGSHDNWHMEFNHGKDNSYYVGTDSKVAASAGNLSFIPNADKTEWKIWGGNTNRWIGWNLNGPAIGVSSKNEDANNNCYFKFTKVVEDIPTAEISLDNTTVTSSQLSELTITFTGDNAAQVQLSTENHTAYLTPKDSTPAQVKAQNGKFKAAPAGAIEGNISATDETGKFSINFGDADIASGDYELSIPEGTFYVGTEDHPVGVLTASYNVTDDINTPITYSHLSGATPVDPQWTAWEGEVSDGIKAINATKYTASNLWYIEKTYTFTEGQNLNVIFKWSGNSVDNKRTDVIGVELLDADGNVAYSQYHAGNTGSTDSNNSYTINGIAAGTYKVRYIATTADGQCQTGGTISNVEVPVNGKVYTVYNDHSGNKWYVSSSRDANDCQTLTDTEASDNTQQWIAWGNTTSGYSFYSVASNATALKANDGIVFDIVVNHKTTGVTLGQHGNNARHQAGNKETKTLKNGLFTNGYKNEDSNWSTDFVFVPTGEYAYKVITTEGQTVTYNEKTYNKDAFVVSTDKLAANSVTASEISGKTASVSIDNDAMTITVTYTENTDQETPVSGKVYTVYNDHLGVPYYVSSSQNNAAGYQDLTKTADGTQQWIVWGSAGAGYTLYNLANNSVVMKANSGSVFDFTEDHKLTGVSIYKHGTKEKQGGNRTTLTLKGGLFTERDATKKLYNDEDYEWSTDFVFLPTGQLAYHVEGDAGGQVTVGGTTYSIGQFIITDSQLTSASLTAKTGYKVALTGNVIFVTDNNSVADPSIDQLKTAGTYYVYIQDKATHKYLYNDRANGTETLEGTTSSPGRNNAYIWRITSDGTDFDILNGQGYGYKASADEIEKRHGAIANIPTPWKITVIDASTIWDAKVLYCDDAEGYIIYDSKRAYDGGFFVTTTSTQTLSGTEGGDLDNYKHFDTTKDDALHTVTVRYYTAVEEEDNPYLCDQLLVAIEHMLNGDVGYPQITYEDPMFEVLFEELYGLYLGIYPHESLYRETVEHFNELALHNTSETVMPEYGDAFKLSVRSNNGRKHYYLKNDGTVTEGEDEAEIFVMGSTGVDGFATLFASNNNAANRYLQSNGPTAEGYEAGKTDINLRLMVTEDNISNIQTEPCRRFGTFGFQVKKNAESDETTTATITLDETNKTWKITDAEEPLMKGTFTSAIELTKVEYPYNKPKFAVGNPDDHEGGYASIWLPYPMVFPDGVEAYRATSVENDGILILTKVNENHEAVAAGGYILYKPGQGEDTDPDDAANMPLVLPAPADPDDVTPCEDNVFVGSTENPLEVKEEGSWATFKENYEGTAYVLARKNGVIGYYKYKETESYLPKGKAIWFSNYEPSTSTECMQFSFGDIVEAIKALNGEATDAEIYDLQGHRLNKAVKGQVNVINGKKVMFK